MYLHGSESETGLSRCPYLPPFVMLPSSLSSVDFLHIFSDGKRHHNRWYLSKNDKKKRTSISLIESIREEDVLFKQLSFHFDSIIVNNWQTPRGSQA